MPRILFFLGFLWLPFFPVSAQSTIALQDAPKHIGEKETVCGQVFGGKWLQQSNQQPTLLDMGARYPNQMLTLVIWAEDRKKFSHPPETLYLNKQICVTGEIKNYKGKPEIMITDPAQIKVVP
jgi:hypothetical protein